MNIIHNTIIAWGPQVIHIAMCLRVLCTASRATGTASERALVRARATSKPQRANASRSLMLVAIMLGVGLGHCTYVPGLIHDVNPSQLSGASHRPSLREALLDARRDTVNGKASRYKVGASDLEGARAYSPRVWDPLHLK